MSNTIKIGLAIAVIFAVLAGGAIAAIDEITNFSGVHINGSFATATPAFLANQQGTGRIAEFQDDGTEVAYIDDGGDAAFTKDVSVAGDLAVSGASTSGDTMSFDSGGTVDNETASTITLSDTHILVDGTLEVSGDSTLDGGLDVAGGLGAVAGSSDAVDITDTAAALDGTDVVQMIDVNMTGGATTGVGNELIGLDLGLTTPDVQSRERAIVANDPDWEQAMDAGANPIVSTSQRWFEDGLGDTIHPEIVLLSGSDETAVDPAIAQAQYGVISLVGGNSGASVAADTSEMALGLHWSAAQGGLIFETRLKLVTDIDSARVCAGLSDSIALEQPATNASDVVTDVADDYAAFCYDTGATTKEWWALSADSGTPGTGVGATGVAPTAGTYQTLRIEIDAAGGQARFYIDGSLVKTVTAGAITPATLIGPIVTCQSLTTDGQTLYVDYVMVDSKR